MAERYANLYPEERLEEARRLRTEQLNSVIAHGAKWEQEQDVTISFRETLASLSHSRDVQKQIRRGIFDGLVDIDAIAAVRTPSAKKKIQGRQGAREVRRIEQEARDDEKLDP